MDAEVVAISRLLAVGALQVMIQYQCALLDGAAALAYATNTVTFSIACSCISACFCSVLNMVQQSCRVCVCCGMQLEMEYIFSGLEEEALDISGDELRNSFKGAAQCSAAQHCTAWFASRRASASQGTAVCSCMACGLAVQLSGVTSGRCEC
jgi:hypothetical protein